MKTIYITNTLLFLSKNDPERFNDLVKTSEIRLNDKGEINYLVKYED